MAGAVQPEAGPPLLPTPDLTWDELESFLDSFLERMRRLPGRARGLSHRLDTGAAATTRKA
jgi:hypothetical protein